MKRWTAGAGLLVVVATMVSSCSTTSNTAEPVKTTAAPDVRADSSPAPQPPLSLPVVRVSVSPAASNKPSTKPSKPESKPSKPESKPSKPSKQSTTTTAPANNGNGNGNNGNNGNTAGTDSGKDTGGCALTGPPPAGSGTVTYVRDGRLWELGGQGEVCLHKLRDSEAGQPLWSPDGKRVLLNPSIMLNDTGVHNTGYVAENNGVSWSMPTGKSLIAPAVKDGKLLKRNAGDPGSRKDITFALPTVAAAYHPAGMHIFASGNGPEGAGLYIASNLGTSPRMIAQLNDPSTRIVEIAAPLSGDAVMFIHDHGNGLFHLHRLSLPDLDLTDVLTEQQPVAKLRLGPTGAFAVRLGDCSGKTVTRVGAGTDATLDQGPLAGTSNEPIGWLDDHTVVVGVRDSGCSGPLDVYTVDVGNPAGAIRVAQGVDAAAVRMKVGKVGQLPGDIEAQAPG